MKSTTSLKLNYEFKRLYNKGRNAATKCVVVYTRKNGTAGNRLGITVSTKLGGAVQRNRIRRRIKEAYRLNEHKIRAGNDIVIVARMRARYAKWDELQSSIVYLLGKLGLMK